MTAEMTETVFKVEVPEKLEPDFRHALGIVIKEFIEELELAVAREILSKSKLTEKQAKELGEDVKEGIAKRYGVL